MRIVLDTNILVRANVMAQGPAREIFLKIVHGNHTLITSSFLLRETERVLAYPRVQKMWRLTPQDIREHIHLVERVSHLIHPTVETPVVLTDPDDDPVLYNAVAGKADALCALDQHFFIEEAVQFVATWGV